MIRFFILAACLVLAGCATNETPPPIATQGKSEKKMSEGDFKVLSMMFAFASREYLKLCPNHLKLNPAYAGEYRKALNSKENKAMIKATDESQKTQPSEKPDDEGCQKIADKAGEGALIFLAAKKK